MSDEPQTQTQEDIPSPADAEAQGAEAPGAEAQSAEAAPSPASIDAAALEAEVAKAREDVLRAFAEAENTRKRAAREIADARAYAIEKFARDLLPVADTLSRALMAISPQARSGADEVMRTLLEGVEMTERALAETFMRHGLKRVGAKGEAFDPNLHQAVAQAPADTPANTVAEVMQHGFVLAERTIRPAMVMVSSGLAGAPAQGEAGAEASSQARGAGGVDIKV